jgi:hypothetical protein
MDRDLLIEFAEWLRHHLWVDAEPEKLRWLVNRFMWQIEKSKTDQLVWDRFLPLDPLAGPQQDQADTIHHRLPWPEEEA